MARARLERLSGCRTDDPPGESCGGGSSGQVRRELLERAPRRFPARSSVWSGLQSVTRTHWLAVKIGVVGLAPMAVAGLLSLTVTWWSSPFDRINNGPFSPSMFDRRDMAPIGYAAFAFAFGVTSDVLIRRTLPAMATTRVGFVGARLAFFAWVRPRLMDPLRIVTELQVSSPNGPGSVGTGAANPANWVISEQTINAARKVIGQDGGLGPNASVGFTASQRGTVTYVGVGRCPNKIPVPPLCLVRGSRGARALRSHMPSNCAPTGSTCPRC